MLKPQRHNFSENLKKKFLNRIANQEINRTFINLVQSLLSLSLFSLLNSLSYQVPYLYVFDAYIYSHIILTQVITFKNKLLKMSVVIL